MAAYIPVPRDLTRVKTKVFFNLTKRQLICFSAAALIGLPLFFWVKSFGNVSLASLTMIFVMLLSPAVWIWFIVSMVRTQSFRTTQR